MNAVDVAHCEEYSQSCGYKTNVCFVISVSQWDDILGFIISDAGQRRCGEVQRGVSDNETMSLGLLSESESE